jgi:hypothetical protein
VFKSGRSVGLISSITLKGHTPPTCVSQLTDLFIKFQKKELKNNTSLIINNNIPNLTKFLTSLVCSPILLLSVKMSFHHIIQTHTRLKSLNNKHKVIPSFSFIVKIKVEVVVDKTTPINTGQGDINT